MVYDESNGHVTDQSIRYDTIRYKSLTWTRKLSIQLNLARVARN